MSALLGALMRAMSPNKPAPTLTGQTLLGGKRPLNPNPLPNLPGYKAPAIGAPPKPNPIPNVTPYSTLLSSSPDSRKTLLGG